MQGGIAVGLATWTPPLIVSSLLHLSHQPSERESWQGMYCHF
jgi:hypothetical protein